MPDVHTHLQEHPSIRRTGTSGSLATNARCSYAFAGTPFHQEDRHKWFSSDQCPMFIRICRNTLPSGGQAQGIHKMSLCHTGHHDPGHALQRAERRRLLPPGPQGPHHPPALRPCYCRLPQPLLLLLHQRVLLHPPPGPRASLERGDAAVPPTCCIST